jgi:hypothetical protein
MTVVVIEVVENDVLNLAARSWYLSGLMEDVNFPPVSGFLPSGVKKTSVHAPGICHSRSSA